MTTLAARLEAAPLWTPIASVLLALCWLVPNASAPWMGFHKDVVAAGVMLAVAIAVVARHWRQRRALPVDAMALALTVLGAWCLLQWFTGQVHFIGHAAMGFTYFVAAAALMTVARGWEAEQRRAVGRFLFPAFFIGGLLTAVIVYKQWLDVDGLEVWVRGIGYGTRPYGNLMQPNHAATVLVLGVVSVFWLAAQRRIGPLGVCVAGATLACALVLTESRIGYLSFVLLALAGLVLAPRLFEQRLRASIALLLLVFTAAAIALPWLNASAGELSIAQRPTGQIRWTVWRGFFAAALQHPLAGLGFSPGMVTHVAADAAGHHFPELFTWSHNAFLDVALWFGFPAALVVLGLTAYTGLRVVRSPAAADTALLVAALVAIGLHAMVELPLGYAYFLLPFAMLLGALSTRLALPAVRLDPRGFAAVVVVLAALLGTIVHDYLRVEASFYAWRLMLQRVGLNHVPDIPDTLLLHQYRSYISGGWLPSENMDAQALDDFEASVVLHPSAPAVQALVVALVERGEVQRAQHWADTSRLIVSAGQRIELAAAWRARVAEDGKYAKVRWQQ